MINKLLSVISIPATVVFCDSKVYQWNIFAENDKKYALHQRLASIRRVMHS